MRGLGGDTASVPGKKVQAQFAREWPVLKCGVGLIRGSETRWGAISRCIRLLSRPFQALSDRNRARFVEAELCKDPVIDS